MKRLAGLLAALLLTSTACGGAELPAAAGGSNQAGSGSGEVLAEVGIPDAGMQQGVAAAQSLTYSNLDSAAAVSEVREVLINAGIRAEYVDTVLGWVADYNDTMRACPSFSLVGDFVTVAEGTVYYGEYASMSTTWYKQNHRNYHDVLCRIVAAELIQDNISVGSCIPKEDFDCWDEQTSWLYTDGDILFGREAVEGEHRAYVPFPLLDWDEHMQAKYFTLFNPIPIAEGCSAEGMLQAVQEAWAKRGIVFAENAVSRITFWTQGSGRMCASHAAALIDTGDGYLLFEKTNPEAPYAATSFSSASEVKGYLYRMMALEDSQYGSELGIYLILQNDRPF